MKLFDETLIYTQLLDYAKELSVLFNESIQPKITEKIIFINDLIYDEAIKIDIKLQTNGKLKVEKRVLNYISDILKSLCKINGNFLKTSLEVQENISRNIDYYSRLALDLYLRDEVSVNVKTEVEQFIDKYYKYMTFTSVKYHIDCAKEAMRILNTNSLSAFDKNLLLTEHKYFKIIFDAYQNFQSFSSWYLEVCILRKIHIYAKQFMIGIQDFENILSVLGKRLDYESWLFSRYETSWHIWHTLAIILSDLLQDKSYQLKSYITCFLSANPICPGLAYLVGFKSDAYKPSKYQEKHYQALREINYLSHTENQLVKSNINQIIVNLKKNVKTPEMLATLQGISPLRSLSTSFLEKIKTNMQEKYRSLQVKTNWFENNSLLIGENYFNLSVVNKRDIGYSSSTNVNKLVDTYRLENIITSQVKKQRTLMIGQAGIGKTTLCHYIVSQWAKKELWLNFNWVFFIELHNLRETRYPDKGTYFAIDVLLKECIEFDQNTIQSWQLLGLKKHLIEQELDGKILILLDGYDEITENIPAHLKNVFECLMSTKFLILTSRTYNTNQIETNYEFEKILQISGLTDKSIEDYITTFFTRQYHKEKGFELWRYMQTNPAIRSICNTPINLILICNVWYSSFVGNRKINRPRLTWIIEEVLQLLLRTQLLQSISFNFITDLDKQSVFNSYEELLKLLEMFAFIQVFKKRSVYSIDYVIKKLFNSLQDGHKLLNNILNIGILNIHLSSEFEKLYYFTYSVFRDYFVARFLSNYFKKREKIFVLNIGLKERKNKEVNFKEYLKTHKYDPNFELIWQFFSGILVEEEANFLQEYFDFLLNEPLDLLKINHILLTLRCWDETQCTDKLRTDQTKKLEDLAVYWIKWALNVIGKNFGKPTFNYVLKQFIDTMSLNPSVIELVRIKTSLINLLKQLDPSVILKIKEAGDGLLSENLQDIFKNVIEEFEIPEITSSYIIEDTENEEKMPNKVKVINQIEPEEVLLKRICDKNEVIITRKLALSNLIDNYQVNQNISEKLLSLSLDDDEDVNIKVAIFNEIKRIDIGKIEKSVIERIISALTIQLNNSNDQIKLAVIHALGEFIKFDSKLTNKIEAEIDYSNKIIALAAIAMVLKRMKKINKNKREIIETFFKLCSYLSDNNQALSEINNILTIISKHNLESCLSIIDFDEFSNYEIFKYALQSTPIISLIKSHLNLKSRKGALILVIVDRLVQEGRAIFFEDNRLCIYENKKYYWNINDFYENRDQFIQELQTAFDEVFTLRNQQTEGGLKKQDELPSLNNHFLQAVVAKNLAKVKTILEKESGIDINIQNGEGDSALHIACLNRDFNMVVYLLEKGIDVELSNKNGQTPFQVAESQNDVIMQNIINSHRELLIQKQQNTTVENNEKFFIDANLQTSNLVQLKRVWMKETLRNVLYPILDELSELLISVGAKIVMPNSSFINKISKTGWQLFSIEGKDEHWAVINLQGVNVDRIVQIINSSHTELNAKRMKSYNMHSLVIIFPTKIYLNNEINKIKIQLQTVVNIPDQTPKYSDTIIWQVFEFTDDTHINHNTVHLVGTFNNWLFAENGTIDINNTKNHKWLMKKGSANKWTLKVGLKEGEYEYKFLINGNIWYPSGINNNYKIKIDAFNIETAMDIGQTDINDEAKINKNDSSSSLEIQQPFEKKLNKVEVFIRTVQRGDIDKLQKLLDKGVDVNVKDEGQYQQATALHYAAANGNENLVKFLLKKGADANLADVGGKTAIQWVEAQLKEVSSEEEVKTYTNIIKLLKETLAQQKETTPTTYSQILGEIGPFKPSNNQGQEQLYRNYQAIKTEKQFPQQEQNGSFEKQVGKSEGPSDNNTTKKYNSVQQLEALLKAIQFNDIESINALLKDVDVNARHPKTNITALHQAAIHSHNDVVKEVIKILFAAGADPELQVDGETPSECALSNDRPDIAELIEQARLDRLKKKDQTVLNKPVKTLNRKGLPNLPPDQLIALLNLSDGVVVGTAVDDGGCGFDALAQCLGGGHTEKSLRLACHKYYLNLPGEDNRKEVDSWIKKLGSNNPNVGNASYLLVQYTGEELKDPTFSIKENPTWFMQEIDGRILCNAMPEVLPNGIHVIEITMNPESVGHYLVTKDGYSHIDDGGKVKTLYELPTLVVSNRHFIPVLSKGKVPVMQNYPLEIQKSQQISDSSYWYSDTDINQLLNLMVSDNREANILAVPNDNEEFIQAIRHATGDWRGSENETGSINPALPSLLPLNINFAKQEIEKNQNNHWVGLCIQPNADQTYDIIYVDSKGKSMPYFIQAQITSILGTKLEKVIVKSEGQQNSESDCGAFLVENLICLLDKRGLPAPLDGNGSDIRRKHAELLSTLTNKSLSRLPSDKKNILINKTKKLSDSKNRKKTIKKEIETHSNEDLESILFSPSTEDSSAGVISELMRITNKKWIFTKLGYFMIADDEDEVYKIVSYLRKHKIDVVINRSKRRLQIKNAEKINVLFLTKIKEIYTSLKESAQSTHGDNLTLKLADTNIGRPIEEQTNQEIFKELIKTLENREFNAFIEVPFGAKDVKKLTKMAEKLGFRLKTIPGKGNSFFQAVINQLRNNIHGQQNSQWTTQHLMYSTAQYIINHQSEFEELVRRGMTCFVDAFARGEAWTNDIVITALSDVLKTKIVIVNSDGSRLVKEQLNAETTIYLGYEIKRRYHSLIHDPKLIPNQYKKDYASFGNDIRECKYDINQYAETIDEFTKNQLPGIEKYLSSISIDTLTKLNITGFEKTLNQIIDYGLYLLFEKKDWQNRFIQLNLSVVSQFKNLPSKLKAKYHSFLCLKFYYANEYEKACQSAEYAQLFSMETNSTIFSDDVAIAYCTLGNLLLKKNQLEDAEYYYELSLNCFNISRKTRIAQIGKVYSGLARLALDKEDYNTSLEYHKKSIKLFETSFKNRPHLWKLMSLVWLTETLISKCKIIMNSIQKEESEKYSWTFIPWVEQPFASEKLNYVELIAEIESTFDETVQEFRKLTTNKMLGTVEQQALIQIIQAELANIKGELNNSKEIYEKILESVEILKSFPLIALDCYINYGLLLGKLSLDNNSDSMRKASESNFQKALEILNRFKDKAFIPRRKLAVICESLVQLTNDDKYNFQRQNLLLLKNADEKISNLTEEKLIFDITTEVRKGLKEIKVHNGIIIKGKEGIGKASLLKQIAIQLGDEYLVKWFFNCKKWESIQHSMQFLAHKLKIKTETISSIENNFLSEISKVSSFETVKLFKQINETLQSQKLRSVFIFVNVHNEMVGFVTECIKIAGKQICLISSFEDANLELSNFLEIPYKAIIAREELMKQLDKICGNDVEKRKFFFQNEHMNDSALLRTVTNITSDLSMPELQESFKESIDKNDPKSFTVFNMEKMLLKFYNNQGKKLHPLSDNRQVFNFLVILSVIYTENISQNILLEVFSILQIEAPIIKDFLEWVEEKRCIYTINQTRQNIKTFAVSNTLAEAVKSYFKTKFIQSSEKITGVNVLIDKLCEVDEIILKVSRLLEKLLAQESVRDEDDFNLDYIELHITSFLEFLKQFEKYYSSISYRLSLNLSIEYMKRDKLAHAKNAFREAWDHFKNKYTNRIINSTYLLKDPEGAYFLKSLVNHAYILKDEGNSDKAEQFLMNYIDLRKLNEFKNEDDYVDVCNIAALVLWANGKHQDALKYCQAALVETDLSDLVAEKNVELTLAHLNLLRCYSLIYRAERKYEEAIKYIMYAKEVNDQLPGVFFESYLLLEEAIIYNEKNEYPRYLELLLKAWENLHKNKHATPRGVEISKNLCIAYFFQNKFEEAIKWADIAIKDGVPIYAVYKPQFGSFMVEEANKFNSQSGLEKLKTFCTLVAKVHEEIYGPKHPNTVVAKNDLARFNEIYERQKKKDISKIEEPSPSLGTSEERDRKSREALLKQRAREAKKEKDEEIKVPSRLTEFVSFEKVINVEPFITEQETILATIIFDDEETANQFTKELAAINILDAKKNPNRYTSDTDPTTRKKIFKIYLSKEEYNKAKNDNNAFEQMIIDQKRLSEFKL